MEPARTGFGAGAPTMALGPSQECACAQLTITPCVLLVCAGRGLQTGRGVSPSGGRGGGPILLGLGRVVLCAGMVARPVPSLVGGDGGETPAEILPPCAGDDVQGKLTGDGRAVSGRKNTRNVVRAWICF